MQDRIQLEQPSAPGQLLLIVVSGSSATRGIFAGGRDPNDSNIIDYIEIATEGNAVDFGDLSAVRSFQPTGMSNAHGGL
jgi:hypothetical protein